MISIVPGQTHARAEPEKPFLVLKNAGHAGDNFSPEFRDKMFKPKVSSGCKSGREKDADANNK